MSSVSVTQPFMKSKKDIVKKEVNRKLIQTVITRTYEVEDAGNRVIVEEIQTITPLAVAEERRMGFRIS
jgi:hypothetical protein